MANLERYRILFVGRHSDFARQQADGSYRRVGRYLTIADLQAHLDGKQTLGTYLINEDGRCTCAVFDADSTDGLQVLRQVQARLATQHIPSYLEASRRGGHLWVFLATPILASHIRAWLLPFCPAGMEFYPKQAEGVGYGSLIRLPLGVHLRSGKRYPFVTWTERGPVPVARSISETLAWLATVQRADVPALPAPTPCPTQAQDLSPSKSWHKSQRAKTATIRDWCAAQDPRHVIGAYVELNSLGVGQCPFDWHHTHGRDTCASLKVYDPGPTSNYCWYCYTWQQGGSVFDFLRYWHGLDARDMWKRLQAEQKSEVLR
ncbi:MAG: TOTE conflict system archaeo-eukaryotic primase domain-containing protein [Ktedonobacteraceae bacterium]